jgi:hypothetical protein
LLLVSWRTPDTYHTAGLERGNRHLNFYETREYALQFERGCVMT